MDTRLRTSFVPKKTLLAKGSFQTGSESTINPFLSLAIIIFFLSVIVAGGAYLYKTLLEKQITTSKAELVKARDAFEEQTIVEWKRRDDRIIVAGQLLEKHMVVTPIFTLLEGVTLKTTRFTSFGFDSTGGNLSLKMEGEGLSYTSVALLSDSFNDQKLIKNPMFSNLVLSDKGGVKFSFTGSVDPSVVSYKEFFNQKAEAQQQ